MDVYGSINPSSDSFNFPIDDLLDFSSDGLFSSTTTSSSTASTSDHLPSLPSFHHHHHSSSFHPAAPDFSPDYFAHQLSLPNDDVAELEWLSQFVDDSFADFPPNSLAAINVVQSTAASSASRGRAARSKRSRLPAVNGGGGAAWKVEGGVSSRASSPTPEGGVRRCTHCASEKTPQWRTGPMGPKTLCNACGVRYKSGRLVPEYRPAASPTFVLTQHSNSHRKVVELRRQKEMMVMRQQSGAVGRASTMYNNNQAEEQDFNVY